LNRFDLILIVRTVTGLHLSAVSLPPLFFAVRIPRACPPDTARLRRPRALPAASPPPPLPHAEPGPHSLPLLFSASAQPPSAPAILMNPKRQQPRRAAGRRLTSPHRATSSKAGAVTTPSIDERHCSLTRCLSFAAESGRHLRRAHPASPRLVRELSAVPATIAAPLHQPTPCRGSSYHGEAVHPVCFLYCVFSCTSSQSTAKPRRGDCPAKKKQFFRFCTSPSFNFENS
jgi:hypothetical protein